MALPRITILATGGTIAGTAASATDATGYRAATTEIDDILRGVPGLDLVAQLTGEQFAQIDSSDLTDALLLGLARRVDELLADDAVDGIVITHGTDTLEESAYFLHLVARGDKPIVLVGAMRPPTALSADGPRNLYAAVVAAASASSRARGVLVVMDDEIHSARDVTKTASLRLGAFESTFGPLGVVVDGHARYYRTVSRPHTSATEFTVPASLPSAAIVYAHSGLDDHFIVALTGYDIVVHAGFGNGTVSGRIVDALQAARAAGALIVRATRTGSGTLTRIGASRDDANGWVVVDDQDPSRARLLASLALGITRDPDEIQRMFYRY